MSDYEFVEKAKNWLCAVTIIFIVIAVPLTIHANRKLVEDCKANGYTVIQQHGVNTCVDKK